MNKLFNILNGLSMTDKALLVVLIGLVLLLIIMVIIFACTRKSAVTDVEASLDFFDELKKDYDNTKSVFVSDENEEVKEEKVLAVKIEDDPKPKMDLESISNQMEKDIEKNNIDLTDFEIEQEEKAIISYKELLDKVNQDNLSNVTVQEVDLDDRGYTLPEVENEFTYDTEVLDFSDILSKTSEFKASEFISPVNGIESPSTEMIKKTDIKSILDIDDLDQPIYNSSEFLSALKELRDSLQ